MSLGKAPLPVERAIQSARLYADQKAAEIVSSPEYAGVRERIEQLIAVQHLRSIEVAQEIRQDMRLAPSVSIQTASSIVRRVARKIISGEILDEVYAGHHAKSLDRHRQGVSDARDDWMMSQGMNVWSAEQRAYFRSLLASPDMKRTETRYHHGKLSAAMNDRFPESEITAEHCRDKLEAMRAGSKKKAGNRTTE